MVRPWRQTAREWKDLQEAVSSWSLRDLFASRFLQDVARSGSEGTALLAEEIHRRSQPAERTYFARALGCGSGDADVEELRSATTETGPGTTELRCVSLVALAKRLGADATEDLAVALSDRAGAVRLDAMYCLAAVGHGSAYEAGWSQLVSWLKRPVQHEGELYAVVYLLRTSRLDRVVELRDLLDDYESSINPRVLLRIWPDVFSTKVLTQEDAVDIRTLVWSWFANGPGRGFSLPQQFVTYA
jgi:hypothetical protein